MQDTFLNLFTRLVASELAMTGILGPQNTKGIGILKTRQKPIPKDGSSKANSEGRPVKGSGFQKDLFWFFLCRSKSVVKEASSHLSYATGSTRRAVWLIEARDVQDEEALQNQ